MGRISLKWILQRNKESQTVNKLKLENTKVLKDPVMDVTKSIS